MSTIRTMSVIPLIQWLIPGILKTALLILRCFAFTEDNVPIVDARHLSDVATFEQLYVIGKTETQDAYGVEVLLPRAPISNRNTCKSSS